MYSGNGSEIAIVGMNCRFPGAGNVESFWENLASGRESITFFNEDELAGDGIEPSLLKTKKYVKAGSILEDIDKFDASFFGFTPREAEILDPQHRLFLENCWETLELAGYTPEKYHGRIGVYAGVFTSSYLFNIYTHPDLVESVGEMAVRHGNEKDYLATRISYKLNLKGPSVNVQTSCSTSLVAVHLAVQSLLGGECDMALAGGVSIIVPQKAGYTYQEGGILTPDGHCRPFDANAKGTIFGSGVGVVVLKRLDDALEDGDTIHAVIKGSAINNDGSDKVGFTAPSINGQVEVIADALAMAGVDPGTIGMIEAHGTGTPLGDPIEIAALTRAFRSETENKKYCAIGSVKSNIGHLGAASGIAGLIKAVLCLKHRAIVPSLHFEEANPNINFEDSPFYVNTQFEDWKNPTDVPRRAGVSSFGMGGTNAHVVLEEMPGFQEQPEAVKNTEQLIVLSARTDVALEQTLVNLSNYLEYQTNTSIADVAYTLQVGRREFEQRAMFVAQSREEALEILSHPERRKVFKGTAKDRQRIAFVFPGQGAQYVDMARGLYESETVFRQTMDFCADFLRDTFDLDIRKVLYDTTDAQRHEKLKQTGIAQPALFAVEYSLVKLLEMWGVKPDIMLGHSVGEYVAACVAGVFSLEDALRVVAIRGQLMQLMPEGDMLSVHLPESQIRDLMDGSLSLAAVNTPELCVVSGPRSHIESLRVKLETEGIKTQLLHTSHAFHSSMMDPILEEFKEQVGQIRKHAPSIPFISNLTGKSAQTEEITDVWYWADHLRHTVQFSAGLSTLLEHPDTIVLEVGPGQTLTGLINQHPNSNATHTIVPLCRHPKDQQSDSSILKQAIGRLWLEGVSVLWGSQHTEEKQKRRIPLPTYPFEKKRYWIERSTPRLFQATTSASAEQVYVKKWVKTVFIPTITSLEKDPWLLVRNRHDEVGQLLEETLTKQNVTVFTETGIRLIEACQRHQEKYGKVPGHIVYLVPQNGDMADLEAFIPHIEQHPQELTSRLSIITTGASNPGASSKWADRSKVSVSIEDLMAHCSNTRCFHLDVNLPVACRPEQIVPYWTNELLARREHGEQICYYGLQRYVLSVEESSFPELPTEYPVRSNVDMIAFAGKPDLFKLLMAEMLTTYGYMQFSFVVATEETLPSPYRYDADCAEILDRLAQRGIIVKEESSRGYGEGERGELLSSIRGLVLGPKSTPDAYAELVSMRPWIAEHCPAFVLCIHHRREAPVRGSLLDSEVALASLARELEEDPGIFVTSALLDRREWSIPEQARTACRLAIHPMSQVILASRKDFAVHPVDGAETSERSSNPGESPIESSQQPSIHSEFTELEQQVIHIWEELFGIPHLSLDDNFFELGGSSLQAIQLMSLVRDRLNIEIELESMFDDPTIGGLVKQVAATLALETEEQKV